MMGLLWLLIGNNDGKRGGESPRVGDLHLPTYLLPVAMGTVGSFPGGVGHGATTSWDISVPSPGWLRLAAAGGTAGIALPRGRRGDLPLPRARPPASLWLGPQHCWAYNRRQNK